MRVVAGPGGDAIAAGAGPTDVLVEPVDQAVAGGDAELAFEEHGVGPEATERLGQVALGEVGVDEAGVRALPERLEGDRDDGGLDGLGVLLGGQVAAAERLERVERELAQPLPLEHDPVVVPVGQELGPERRRPQAPQVDRARRR